MHDFRISYFSFIWKNKQINKWLLEISDSLSITHRNMYNLHHNHTSETLSKPSTHEVTTINQDWFLQCIEQNCSVSLAKNRKLDYRFFSEIIRFFLFTVLVASLIPTVVWAGRAKIVLYQGNKRQEVSTRECESGVFMKNSTSFTCACVTGVWGFYSGYCTHPYSIVAGDSYCFKMRNHYITQMVSFGSLRYPFEPSLSIFHKDFHLLTGYHTDDNDTHADPLSSFITIMDISWTLYGDNAAGESVCLKMTDTGKRKFCLFRAILNEEMKSIQKWKVISKVKLGCFSEKVLRPDSCSDIMPPSDLPDCSVDMTAQYIFSHSTTIIPTTELNYTTTPRNPPLGWIKIKPLNYTDKPKNHPNLRGWIKIKPKNYTTASRAPSILPGWIKIKPKNYITTPRTPLNLTGWIKIKPLNYTTASRAPSNLPGWIKIKPKNYTTPTSVPTEVWIKIKPKKYEDLAPNNHSLGWVKIKPIKYSIEPAPRKSDPSGWIKVKPKLYSTLTPSINLRFDAHSDDHRWIKIKPKQYTTTTEKPIGYSEEAEEGVWIPIKSLRNPTTTTTTPASVEDDPALNETMIYFDLPGEESGEIGYPVETTSSSTAIPESSGENVIPTKSPVYVNVESESEETWIPILRPVKKTPKPRTTTEVAPVPTTSKPQRDICKMEVTRDLVKDYWLDPGSNACSRSINEAVFTDQLRRFTVKQFDRIFDSRLKSFQQMEELLNYTKSITQKTCGEEFVPGEFFEVARSAFLMFVQEDFFYGVEGAIPDVYKRVLKALKKCEQRAQPHVFESNVLKCGIKKINGFLIVPGDRVKLEVPQKNSWKNFEPLIETAWKMFLNTHSYCFSDFKYSNDHHHFSVLMMELFSKTIYEKWIEPLDSLELYRFILPNYNFLKETMDNIDFCVSATNQISSCPAWLARSGLRSPSRKKRSIWVDDVKEDSPKSEVWDGEAFCLHRMDDPDTKLHQTKCDGSVV